MQTASYFRLTTSGKIQKELCSKTTWKDFSSEDLNPSYHSSIYPVLLPESNIYLLLEEENDLHYPAGKLPINQALRKYYPISQIRGDVLIIALDDQDRLVSLSDLDFLKNYIFFEFHHPRRVNFSFRNREQGPFPILQEEDEFSSDEDLLSDEDVLLTIFSKEKEKNKEDKEQKKEEDKEEEKEENKEDKEENKENKEKEENNFYPPCMGCDMGSWSDDSD